MQFVRVDNGTSSSCIVRLDLQGLKLDIPEEQLAPLLDFPSSTFKHINKPDPVAWRNIFDLPHKFFATLNESELKELASLYVICNAEMMKVLDEPDATYAEILTLESTLSKHIYTADQRINMFPRLVQFSESNVSFPNMEGVGERAQDSVEMTFYRDDILILITLSILGKVLMPIFTTFIEKCRTRVSNDLKEVHCATLLKDILYYRCQKFNEKLVNYVIGLSKRNITNLSPTQIFVGSTPLNVIEKSHASVLVKKLVSVDIVTKADANIATYLSSCIRSTTSNGNKSSKASAMNMFTPNDNEGPGSLMGSDDGNTSILEAEAMVSSKTADCTIIVSEAVKQARARFTADYDLELDDVIKLEDYYKVNHITLTPFNSYMCALVFGDYMLGAKSVELLTNEALVSLVSMLQLYLISQGHTELVHLASAVPTDNVKVRMSGNDTQLRATYTNSYEFRNCCNRFNLVFDNLDWSTGLTSLVDELTSKVYLVNTAPLLYEKMNSEPSNGSPLETPLDAAKALCSLALVS